MLKIKEIIIFTLWLFIRFFVLTYIYMRVSSLGKLMVRQLNRPFISNRSTKAICMKVKITLLFDNSKSEF